MEDVNRIKLVLVEKNRIELTDAVATKYFLVKRYKDTLSELARRVADYEHEVNDYLKEIGFLLN